MTRAAPQAEEDEEQLTHHVIGQPPWEVHNHYSQSKNGNGNGRWLNVLMGLCGALLLILVAITGFMWSSQIEFQSGMIDRMARIETRLDAIEDRP